MRHLTFDWNGKTEEPTCFIFGAGAFYGLCSFPKAGDLIIAADGGLRYLQKLGLHPDIILGDFDSEDEDSARQVAESAESLARVCKMPGAASSAEALVPANTVAPASTAPGFIQLSVTKDRSDSAAAIQCGKARGFRRFYLYGCTGMRLDHTLATIQDMAALAEEGLSAYLFDDGAVLTLIQDAALDFPAGLAGGISVFAYGGRAEQVWESGLQYTVAEHVLTDTFPLGLSNAFTALPASVSVGQGKLLIHVRPEGGLVGMPEGVRFIIGELEAHGYEAYAVGGCVRDSMLGRKPEDWDITTSARPEAVKAVFKKTVDTGIAHGTVTVMLREGSGEGKSLRGYEVTTYRVDGDYLDGRHPSSVAFTPSLSEDLRRRDFTINAMAYNERAGLVDLFHGVEDLKAKVLRCVGTASERFEEDALRILRAVRFAAQLNFDLEAQTETAMRQQAANLRHVSKERILAELTKLVCAAYPERGEALFRLGMAPYLCAGFEKLRIEPLRELHEQARTASKGTTAASGAGEFGALLRLLPRAEGEDPDAWRAAFDAARETSHAFRYLRFAFLMLGSSGAEAERILRALRADNETIRKTKLLTEQILQPIPAERFALKQVMQQMEPQLFCDLLLAKRACAGTRLYRACCPKEDSALLLKLLQDVLREKEPVYLRQLAVTGADLMQAGIPAGPALGKCLKLLLTDVQREPSHNEKAYLLAVAGMQLQRPD